MKLTTLILLLILAMSPIQSWSQTHEKYLTVYYGSICCGTLPVQPVIDFVEGFETQNQLQPLEIFSIGWGREGEFTLYIGITHLTDDQINHLLSGLKQITNNQNQHRIENSDGTVRVNNQYTHVRRWDR